MDARDTLPMSSPRPSHHLSPKTLPPSCHSGHVQPRRRLLPRRPVPIVAACAVAPKKLKKKLTDEEGAAQSVKRAGRRKREKEKEDVAAQA